MTELLDRGDIPEENKWNVEEMFSSPVLWEETYNRFKGVEEDIRWPDFQAYKGKLHEPSVLKEALEEFFQLDRELMKLYVYAHLRYDEDLSNDKNKETFLKITTLVHQFSSEISWIQPELLSISQGDFQNLLDDESLSPYKNFLEKIAHLREHTLSEKEERLMALSGNALKGAHDAFSSFENADLTFEPAMDSEGKAHPLSLGSYGVYLKSNDRTLRKNAYENLHRAFGNYENTLCSLLSTQVQTHLFNARARGYKSCLEAALHPNHIDLQVYHNLISSVKKHLPSLHKYVSLRKKSLGVDKLYSYDLYVSLFPENFSFTYEEAKEYVVQSVAPLGEKYQQILEDGLGAKRWVDVYENKSKRSGAYSSGCYDSSPYILMNYHGTLRDLMTLAHEAGHSMHSYHSNTHQPYQYASYPIFLAEVASTFQEQLLLDYLLEKFSTPQDKAALLNYALEGIRQTLIRQTLFAEFELFIHECAEKNIPLTPTLLKEKYIALKKEYYGPDLELDDFIAVEWARIPHFYYNFYVYQYATGISTAFALHKKLMEDPSSINSYLDFLSSGCREFPLETLRKAGADLTDDTVVSNALQKFDALVLQLEQMQNELSEETFTRNEM